MTTLEASAHVVDQELWINYRVVNRSAQVLYLFNVLSHPDRQRCEYSTGIAYVNACPPASVLFLQGWAPLPKDRYLLAPTNPGATRVRSNQVAECTLRFPLPLREWHCYAPVPDDRTPTQTVEIERATLLIDSLLDADKFEDPMVYSDLPDVLWVDGDPVQRLRADFKLPCPCPVQLRLDEFARFPPEYVM